MLDINLRTDTALKALMKDLEKQKRDAEAMLYDIEEDEGKRAELEREIVKFEKWVTKEGYPCV